MDVYSIYGIVFFLAFIGSYLSEYLGQSTILGYIIIGIFIGPYLNLTPYGIPYNGIVQNPSTLQVFANIGLIFIFFFIGLNFTINKLSSTKIQAVILSFIDISFNFVAGVAIGIFFHWSLLDTLFLASIITMSSTAITVKALEDLKRINGQETNLLLSVMIIEDFASIIIITILSSTYIGFSASESIALIEILGLITLIAFYVILTLVFIPAIKKKIIKTTSDEVVILLVISVIMLSGSLAAFFKISPIIGAFFIGMALSETELSKTVESKIRPIGYMFIAIFFIYVGSLIDPFYIDAILPIIILSIISIIIVELFIMSSFTYFLGFSSRIAVAIGAGLVPRNEESIVYASIAPTINTESGKPLISHANLFYPIAGIIAVITTSLTPTLVKYAGKLNDFFSSVLPTYIKVSANTISKTVRSLLTANPYLTTNSNFYILLPILFNFGFLFGYYLTYKAIYPFILLPIPLIIVIDYYIIKNAVYNAVTKTSYINVDKGKNSALHFVSNVLTAIFSIIFIPISFTVNSIYVFYVISFVIMIFMIAEFYIYYNKIKHSIKLS